MLRAGPLNRRVEIQRRGADTDDWGQKLPESWVPHAQLWAHIKYLSGSQSIKADAPTSVARASIRIRYRAGIDAGMRVVHGATVYNIRAVLPDETSREHMDLVCEVVA